eukprot:m.182387 g.182387  ORF g.182387 m.182387 type:complete len:417 (-) comp25481_c1_seq2:276-1526(-)
MSDDEVQELTDRPKGITFRPEGEEFYLASKAGKYLNRMPSTVFSLYPSMYRRQATIPERSLLERTKEGPRHPLKTLVLASEIQAIAEQEGGRIYEEPTIYKLPLAQRGFNLVRSAHAPILPALPDVSRPVIRAKNPLAKYYDSPTGCASRTDTEPQILVPIRMFIEQDGVRYRDTFLYNANDTIVTPRLLAEITAQDLELPNVFISQIEASISSQVRDFLTVQEAFEGPRIATLKLEVQLGSMLIEDQILWDHGDLATTPEQFASSMCAELGLGGEAVTSLAFSIREQLFFDQKAALRSNSPEQSIFEAQTSCFRTTNQEEWSPNFVALTDPDVEKREMAEEREGRRRRRTARTDEEEQEANNRSLQRGFSRRSTPRARSSGPTPSGEINFDGLPAIIFSDRHVAAAKQEYKPLQQ